MAAACSQCGSPQTDGDVFCGNCGQPMAQNIGGANTSKADIGRLVDLSSPMLATPVTASGPSPATRAPWPGDGDARHSTGLPPTRTDGGQARDAAVGQATPNATYVGQRLLFDKQPEQPFDPLFNSRILAQMRRHALHYLMLYFIGGFLAAIPFGLLSIVAGIGAVLWVIGAVVTGIILLCVYWLVPIPALLSEWKFSVDGMAPAAPATFEHITWSLRRRRTPLDQLQVRRLSLPGEGKRDYLELRQGLFAGYVACFPYGEDLYVGWTLWVCVSPARLLFMRLARIWQSITQRGSDLFVTLRYDSARAMREAMHSTAREGIDVAVGQIPAEGHGIIGTAVAVSEVGV